MLTMKKLLLQNDHVSGRKNGVIPRRLDHIQRFNLEEVLLWLSRNIHTDSFLTVLNMDILRGIPAMHVNEKGRLQCYICQKTYSRVDLNAFIDHLHKHRTNTLCGFNEKERMVRDLILRVLNSYGLVRFCAC